MKKDLLSVLLVVLVFFLVSCNTASPEEKVQNFEPIYQSFSDVVYVDETSLKDFSYVHTFMCEPLSNEKNVLTLDRFILLIKNEIMERTLTEDNKNKLFENFFNQHFIDEAKQFYFSDSIYFELNYESDPPQSSPHYYGPMYFYLNGYRYIWDYYEDFESIKTYYGTYTLQEAKSITDKYDLFVADRDQNYYVLTHNQDFNEKLEKQHKDDSAVFVDPHEAIEEIIDQLVNMRFLDLLDDELVASLKLEYKGYKVETYQEKTSKTTSFASFIDKLYAQHNK